MRVIIRNTPLGKRAFPISVEDVDQLLSDGKAKQINAVLFEAIAEEEQDSFYGTKMLTADAPRRRGRPPKAET